MSLKDLKKWGGMYDSYENVSKRFRTFTYFVRTFLTYLSMDLGSTRNIERSVSSYHLPDRLVLVIHTLTPNQGMTLLYTCRLLIN